VNYKTKIAVVFLIILVPVTGALGACLFVFGFLLAIGNVELLHEIKSLSNTVYDMPILVAMVVGGIIGSATTGAVWGWIMRKTKFISEDDIVELTSIKRD